MSSASGARCGSAPCVAPTPRTGCGHCARRRRLPTRSPASGTCGAHGAQSDPRTQGQGHGAGSGRCVWPSGARARGEQRRAQRLVGLFPQRARQLVVVDEHGPPVPHMRSTGSRCADHTGTVVWGPVHCVCGRAAHSVRSAQLAVSHGRLTERGWSTVGPPPPPLAPSWSDGPSLGLWRRISSSSLWERVIAASLRACRCVLYPQKAR